MAVIAMTREMGSRGRDVAVGLAEELGLALVQHQVVEHVADKMHLPESSVNRFLEGKANLLERWGINERDLSLFTAEEILDVAQAEGAVIRGWGATYILRDIPHIPCVRVCAPLEQRVAEVMARVGLKDEAVARKEVRRNDAAHARTMSHLFNVNFENPLLYDLVLNTARLSIADCVATIRNLLESDTFRATRRSLATLAHRKIEAAIASALRGNEITSQLTPSFEAKFFPETGMVRLSGVASSESHKAEAGRVVREVAGVKDVINEMIVIRTQALGP